MNGDQTHELKWHTSPWPIILSVGILFLIPLSFTFHFVYKTPLWAVVSLGIGAPLTIVSIIGWVREGIEDVHGYGEGLVVWAMPIFLVAEAMLFAAFFIMYWLTRLSAPAWPPALTPEISTITPLVMTVILVASSVTIHFAEEKMDREDSKGFLTWLAATIILAIIFLGFTAFEWAELFHEGFRFSTNIYSTSLYSITGFHASHVIVGLGVFVCVLIPAFYKKINKPFVRAASMYWHFVDIVWFFVVSQIYLW